MKKNDQILIIIVLLAAAVSGIFLFSRMKADAGTVIIRKDGSEYGSYLLSEDQEIIVGDANTVRIRGGMVKMIYADCPDQICVNHKEISRNGESIICLPNKIIVEIKAAGNESEIDTMTNYGASL